MRSHHGFDVAGMIPLRVLLHLHEEDHPDGEPGWHGSPDASRGPGFIAGKHMAAWRHEDVQPGDQISQQEQHARLRAMREHMRGLGFPVRDADSRGYELLGPHFTLDSGHEVSVGHSLRNQEWHAVIAHPGDDSASQSVIGLNLGVNADHVAPLLAREIGREPVVGEMREQWQRAHAQGLEPPPPRWRNPDGSRWNPRQVSFTARGAQVSGDGGEDY